MPPVSKLRKVLDDGGDAPLETGPPCDPPEAFVLSVGPPNKLRAAVAHRANDLVAENIVSRKDICNFGLDLRNIVLHGYRKSDLV